MPKKLSETGLEVLITKVLDPDLIAIITPSHHYMIRVHEDGSIAMEAGVLAVQREKHNWAVAVNTSPEKVFNVEVDSGQGAKRVAGWEPSRS